jgi:hypothetical protein
LYDFTARNYDPQIGRWNSADPLTDVNRRWSSFAYAADNPIRYIDPDGMQYMGYGFDGDDDAVLSGEAVRISGEDVSIEKGKRQTNEKGSTSDNAKFMSFAIDGVVSSTTDTRVTPVFPFSIYGQFNFVNGYGFTNIILSSFGAVVNINIKNFDPSTPMVLFDQKSQVQDLDGINSALKSLGIDAKLNTGKMDNVVDIASGQWTSFHGQIEQNFKKGYGILGLVRDKTLDVLDKEIQPGLQAKSENIRMLYNIWRSEIGTNSYGFSASFKRWWSFDPSQLTIRQKGNFTKFMPVLYLYYSGFTIKF